MPDYHTHRRASGGERTSASLPYIDLDVLRWLINIRSKVAVGLLLVLLAAWLATDTPAGVVLNVALVDAGLFAFNAVYAYLLRGHPSHSTVGVLRRTLIPFDLLLCTFTVYVGGGALTPVFLVYTFALLESIILLDPSGVYYTAGVAVTLYGFLALLEGYGQIPYVRAYWGEVDYHTVASHTTYLLYILGVGTLFIVAAYMANRIALIISQRNQQIESRLGDLRALYDVTDGLGSITDEGEIARYLVGELLTLEHAATCLIGLLDKSGVAHIKAAAGVSPEEVAGLPRMGIFTPELSDLLVRGEPLIIEDAAEFRRGNGVLINAATRSVYAFPIRVEAEVLGFISLSFDSLRPLSPEYRELLRTIAVQAGVALQRARLFNDTQRLAREMTELYDVGLRTGSTLSTREVLKRTADNLATFLNPEAYYIALYDEVNDVISFEIFMELGEPLPRLELPLQDGGLAGHIIRTRAPLLVEDWRVEGESYNLVARKMGADTLSYLGVPILWENRVTGVISVQSTNVSAFDARDQRLLLALSVQTAMALENARLHQLAQDQARFDSLTLVYNHGAFVEIVDAAVADAKSGGSQVSLIMVDVDYFKHYNDTYGHPVGDSVLVMVAGALRGSVRTSDVVGRWGGEEFGVLLPDTPLAVAQKIAARIQIAVAELAPVDVRGNFTTVPTVSQGLSSYPYPAASAAELIKQADAALYSAKWRGRNRLILTESAEVASEL